MSEPDPAGGLVPEPELVEIGALLLDADGLVRAVGSGRRRGRDVPWRRVEARYVDLKAGRHLQVVAYDDTQAHTSNHRAGDDARRAVADLLGLGFGSWHVESTASTHQLRFSKKDRPLAHSTTRDAPVEADHGHDRAKRRLLDGDPLWQALGLAEESGRIKPSRHDKWRQVTELLGVLDVAVPEAIEAGHLRRPTPEQPLVLVDLGCGNGYLTFAAHRLLSQVHGLPVRVVGVDTKQQSAAHNEALARTLGLDPDDARFVVGSIAEAELPEPADSADVVLALHACDTATDEALARAAAWDADLVLAAPCCHHDVAAQLRRGTPPGPYALLTRHGILRERLADTLTDGLRAALMRTRGYRVDVMEFVASEHTPRNTLLRAVRTGADDAGAAAQYEELVTAWRVRPRLAELLEGATP